MADNNDLINVYAYIRGQLKKGVKEAQENMELLSENQETLDRVEDGITDILDMLRDLGVSEDALAAIDEDPEDHERPAEPVEITLPADTDWQAKFREYVKKAEERGFVDVTVEELLTAEELASAEEKNRKTDELFAAATKLDEKDMLVVSAGVLLHLIRYFLLKDKQIKMPEPEPQAAPVPEIDAVGEIKSLLAMLPFPRKVEIKGVDAILADAPSFTCVHDSRYGQQEFLGNHMLWGWVAGVFNILTDTVTTSTMQTFQPVPGEEVSLSPETLMFTDLFLPFMGKSAGGLKNQIVASVVREAFVLLPNQGGLDNLQASYSEQVDLVEEVLRYLPEAQAKDDPRLSVSGVLKQTGAGELITLILLAVHSILKPQDADPKQYRVRTFKVLTLANAIGSSLASIPAILAQDYLKADFGGFVTLLQNSAALTKLMIDAKTEFLVSQYLPTVQSRLRDLDKYIK